MMSKSQSILAAAAAGALVLPFGCKLEPEVPELHYELNAPAIEDNPTLADDPEAQAKLRGALEMLFGTPAAPGYMRLSDWIDDEFDPDDGAAALSDEEYDALKASNRLAFAQQIRAIAEGRFDELRRPVAASELWARWQSLLADKPDDPDAAYDEDFTWRQAATYEFESFYPSLAESAQLFRRQCVHCHGASGAGDGSTARFLNPLPRDYRPGIFKFTALNNKARPRNADIYRVLTEGIYTTKMPSFRRFSDARLHGLVDYVTLLSKRGETELLLISDYDEDEGLAYEKIKENYEFVFDRWDESADEVIVYEGEVPHSTPARVAHGRELFTDPKQANCVQCHGEHGRGTYDDPRPASAWERDPETGEQVLVKDDWGHDIEVRNLSRGLFRFGRRPIDLFRRVYAGINGTPMPAHFGMQITEPDGTQRKLDENDIWDLVHYVRSLAKHDHIGPIALQAGSDHGEGH